MASSSRYSADIFLPGIEDHVAVQGRFAKASLFTMHSIKGAQSGQEEAFGVAFLDAMSHGLPVVTGNSGGVSEIVNEGITGFLVTPGDIEAHADRMAQLISNRRVVE